MNSKVKVTADDAGNVIIPSQSNPEWGYIRVIQDRMFIDDNGFARKKTLSALIPGLVTDLKGFDWKNNQEVSGSIVVRESFESFNAKEPERDYKIAGKSGIVCCQDGQPNYRKSFYTLSTDVKDFTIEHNNGDAIKAAYVISKETVATTETSDFAL